VLYEAPTTTRDHELAAERLLQHAHRLVRERRVGVHLLDRAPREVGHEPVARGSSSGAATAVDQPLDYHGSASHQAGADEAPPVHLSQASPPKRPVQIHRSVE
jgi:hypothetical protein